MRKLIILRGAMGAGKSTFIKENHLENYTLCPDTFRLFLHAPEMTSEYTEKIPQYDNQKVWSLLYYFLEERMKKGEFTIIDAVHAYKEDFSMYKKLAEKYRYRTFVIDFTKIPIEEVLKRNQTREGYKIVPENSIKRVYKAFEKEEIPKNFQIIEKETWRVLLNTDPVDKNSYQNIHIFGDIHGCINPVKTYFKEHPLKEEDAYIFLGDYFDRGVENVETFTFLSGLQEKKNCIFLIGNHEDKLYKYACDDPYKKDLDSQRTIQELENAGIQKKEIRGFIKKLSQVLFITFRGKTYFLNHGGVPFFPEKSLDFYSTNSFIYGIDNYELDIDILYQKFMEKNKTKIIQIHGHRNYQKKEIDTYNYSYNLDGNIEHGGYLRVLSLLDDGTYSTTCLPNPISNPNIEEENNVFALIETLRNNKYVYERELTPTISSFNFTKEAFYNHIWDTITTKARGLFLDTKNYRVVARSYNKFFKVGERKETKIELLQEKLFYPVSFYLKYNGFLGILSYHKNDFFFASKSTNTGEYVEYFKTIFYELYNKKQREAIKEKIRKENMSFLFEVIDPINDPHIIEYQKPTLILLDMISNQTQEKRNSYEVLKTFGEENNIEVKQCSFTAKNKEEFLRIYEEVTQEEYQYQGQYIEGFVLEDASGFQTKIKTEYYSKWKYLRGKMEKALQKNDFTCEVKEPLEREFMAYLKEKYESQEIQNKKVTIIEERKNFLKEKVKN